MSLAAGTRLGAYEIVALIGAGGMGEVYRAKDTRLDRTVAIKVLPLQFAADAEARARFEREGRAISSLDHPHICALYDVGEHDGSTFLVMQHLDGETLEARLQKGALPLGQATQIAVEIADALDKAHRAGIVHRDLKPANIMLTKSGAKLLDFGLSKSAAPVVATSGLSMLPTTPPSLTAQGTILGTFQYMAPEQIEGLEADARTDIFAFGAVLFEMITGRRAFEGKSRASLLGAILKDEPPPVSSVQAVAPTPLDRIVSTCLAKDPDDRYQSARDLLRDLKWAAGAGAVPHASVSPPARRLSYSRLAWAAAAVLLVAFSIIAARHLSEPVPSAAVMQFAIPPPDKVTFNTPPGGGTGIATQAAVSPDGTNIVFVASSQNKFQLWLRPLASGTAHPIPGTEEGTFPFWSPDSRYIGFFANGKLKKVHVAGGPPVPLCDAPSGRGGTWNRDNVIVFAPAPNSVLHRVASAGGLAQPVSVLDQEYGESGHRFPSFLPDGRHFIYTGIIGTCCPATKPARIRTGTLDAADTTTLLQAESSAVVASGHLLFNRDGTLMAAPFDAAALKMTGDAFPVAERIAREGSRYASFSVSDTGVLLFASGDAGRPTTRLTWMDRAGRELGTFGDPGAYEGIALSSDDRRIAVTVSAGVPENRDISILDVARGTQARFTFDPGSDSSPVWSPDNLRIVFQAIRDGANSSLRQKRVDGTTNEEAVLPPDVPGPAQPADWSSDGRYIAYNQGVASSFSFDVWVMPLFGDRKPFPVTTSQFAELNARFSPDGRWIAFQSSESGQSQIYVQPFPATGGKFMVSKDGGFQPAWRRDGKELFFVSPDARMMSALIDATGEFHAGIPTPLFTLSINLNSLIGGRQYGVTKDGTRFLVNAAQLTSRSTPMTVVVNWLDAVQK